MKKLIALLCLLALPAWGQASSAENTVLGIMTTTAGSPTYPIWQPVSSTLQLPIAVYDAGNNSGYCYTSNGSASPATFQACSGGGGGGSIAFKATTSNVTYYPVFALGATNTATTAYVDTSNPWQYNASTGLTGILGITTTSLTDNGNASLNGTTTIATAQIAAGNAVFTNLTGTTISGTNASLSGTITTGSLQVTGNANLAGTTTISTAQILAGNAIFTTVTGTNGEFTNALVTTLTATTANFTNEAISGTSTIGTLHTTANATMAGTTTVNNISITGTCTGCTATPAAGSIYNIQYNNGSNAFAANAGLNVSTTRAGLDFLSNVTTANLLSLGNNGADVTSYALGESALLAQSTTNLDNTAIGGYALTAVTTGTKNTALGWDAGQIITTGGNNTIIGALVASTTLTTGNGNIYIGNSNAIDATTSSTSNEFKLGNSASPVISATGINTTTPVVSLAGTAIRITSTSSVGIGTTAPGSNLEIDGSSTTVPVLQLVNSANTTQFYNELNVLDSGISAGNYSTIYLGKSLSMNNAFGFGFGYVGAGSVNNFFSINGFGSGGGLGVYGNGNVEIGNTPSTAPADILDVFGAIGLVTTTATAPINGLYLPSANTLKGTTSGFQSILINSTGNDNTSLGFKTLTAITTGTNNTAVGFQAEKALTIDGFNTAIGSNSLATQAATATTSATGNTAIGYAALTAVTTGVSNVALGNNSGVAVTVGTQNTLVGQASGALLTTGTGNTFIGYHAENAVATIGSDNIVIGQAAALSTSSDSNKLNIGNLIYNNLAGTSAPTVSSCGSSPSADAHASNYAGQITVGSGTIATCTVTFASAYSTWNHCRVTPETASVAAFAYSYTTSAITVTGTSLTSDVFDYQCDGY